MRTLLGIGLSLVMGAAIAADDKIDAKKIVGKWTIDDVKQDAKGLLEFTKDGKLNYVVDVKGMQTKLDGTYKLDGNKLSVTMKIGEKETTKDVTVKKLTDEELTFVDTKGETKTMKRAK